MLQWSSLLGLQLRREPGEAGAESDIPFREVQ
jgi:hypothetical protein